MYVCIDFDGTIVDHAFPEIGDPVPGAIEEIKRIQEAGAKIILFTMRSDGPQYGDVLTQAVNYLDRNGIGLYGINKNPDQDKWTSSLKAYGHLYIDDSALGCPLIYPPNFRRPCVDWVAVKEHLEVLF